MTDSQYTEREYRCIRAIAALVREFQMTIAESERANNTDTVMQDIREIVDESIEED